MESTLTGYTANDILTGDTSAHFLFNNSVVYNSTVYTPNIAVQIALVNNGLCNTSFITYVGSNVTANDCNGGIPWSASTSINEANSLPNIRWIYSATTDCFGNLLGTPGNTFEILGSRIPPGQVISTQYGGCLEIPYCAIPSTASTTNLITTGATFASCTTCTATTNPSEVWYYTATPCCGGSQITISLSKNYKWKTNKKLPAIFLYSMVCDGRFSTIWEKDRLTNLLKLKILGIDENLF